MNTDQDITAQPIIDIIPPVIPESHEPEVWPVVANLTNPDEPIVEGDRVRVMYQSGAVEEYYYHAPVDPPPPPAPTYCTPIEFLMRLTSAERVAIRASTDPVVMDWLAIINHPQLSRVDYEHARPALQYLVSVGLLIEDRVDHILA